MKALSKIGITALVLAGISLLVFGVIAIAHPDKDLVPQFITEESICPVAGCTASECHAGDDPPELEPGQVMTCPKVGCTSTECHAYERLTEHYQQPISASLNIWIIGIAVFVVALVLVIRHA